MNVHDPTLFAILIVVVGNLLLVLLIASINSSLKGRREYLQLTIKAVDKVTPKLQLLLTDMLNFMNTNFDCSHPDYDYKERLEKNIKEFITTDARPASHTPTNHSHDGSVAPCVYNKEDS